jgi:hypothetical protein
MAEPTLQEVFGAAAVQDANTLTISKADLAATGLTPSANNKAESLLVALIQLARVQLTPTNQETNADQSITLEDSFDSIVSRNNQNYRQKTISLNLQKLDTANTINPNDY